MSFSNRFTVFFKKALPNPFTIAVLLSVFILCLAFLMPHNKPRAEIVNIIESEYKDSLFIEAMHADKYVWSTGETNQTIVIAKSDLPIEIGLRTNNSNNGYTNSAQIAFTSTDWQNRTIVNNTNKAGKFWQLITAWETDMWQSNLLGFLVQMMLMLVLGHVLALSSPVDRLITYGTQYCTNNAKSAAIICFLTLVVSLFNWGLGLIFGAIFARKVAEHTKRSGISINYGLIGAAGYSGLMVWHGGISGSAPIKASEDNAITNMMANSLSQQQLAELPTNMGFEDTVFSSMNITVSIILLIVLPSTMYLMGKRTKLAPVQLQDNAVKETFPFDPIGAEKLDHSAILSISLGGLLVLFSIYKGYLAINDGTSFNFINPNYINLLLLGLCLMCHKTFARFLKSTDKAISGTTGILIQFPLYFGILGLMKVSGIMTEISEFFITISSTDSYPIYTFFSAGIVNFFVPSGGGQWAVQGPIVIKAAHELNVPIGKSLMALAYGDQVTNMLQPFWALPLLGITGLKARAILPYTAIIMLVGSTVFLLGLLLF